MITKFKIFESQESSYLDIISSILQKMKEELFPKLERKGYHFYLLLPTVIDDDSIITCKIESKDENGIVDNDIENWKVARKITHSTYDYVYYTVKLPNKEYEELKKDSIHKYHINGEIKNILPVEIDNFYNDSMFKGCVVMKFSINLYKFEVQDFVLRYLPHLANSLEKLSSHFKDKYKDVFDAHDLGLFENKIFNKIKDFISSVGKNNRWYIDSNQQIILEQMGFTITKERKILFPGYYMHDRTEVAELLTNKFRMFYGRFLKNIRTKATWPIRYSRS